MGAGGSKARRRSGGGGGIRSVCVYCGASPGARPEYATAAEALGTALAAAGIKLVYGGGNVGLMGKVASACAAAGGEVNGIIPRALMPREVSGSTVGETTVVETMHQRKALMAERSDAFIALPGGYGTLEGAAWSLPALLRSLTDVLASARAGACAPPLQPEERRSSLPLPSAAPPPPPPPPPFPLAVRCAGAHAELVEMLTHAQLGIHDKPVAVFNVCGYYTQLLAFFDSAVGEGFVKQRTRDLLLSESTVDPLLEKLRKYKHDRGAALLPSKSWKATPSQAKALAK